MKRTLLPLLFATAAIGTTQAAVVIGDGADRPFASANADGWSGVSVLNAAVIDENTDPGSGDSFAVTEVSMWAATGRAGGENHLQAILVNASDQIVWASPQLTPTIDNGHNVFPLAGTDTIPAAGGPYRLGVWQWRDGEDDVNGGTVAFGNGGGGMFQINVDGNLGANPVPLGTTLPAAGHNAGPGGRDYHIDIAVSRVPEPTIFPLLALSGLGLFIRRRRS
ncbi:MAG: hypothetical protein CMP28_03870 [Roseibacillus sp.]|nr:hypothetical protein [Roseibacillus sp.]